jgi:hypothetical protein
VDAGDRCSKGHEMNLSLWAPAFKAVAAVLLCLATGSASAASIGLEELWLSAEQIDIYKQVVRADGSLTRELHRSFWAGIPSKDYEKIHEKLWHALDLDLDLVRGNLESQRATAKAHSVTVDPSYAAALAALQAFDPGDEIAQAALRAKTARDDRLFHQQLEQLMGQLRPGDKDVEYVSKLVDRSEHSLSAARNRVERLLDPAWRDASGRGE